MMTKIGRRRILRPLTEITKKMEVMTPAMNAVASKATNHGVPANKEKRHE